MKLRTLALALIFAASTMTPGTLLGQDVVDNETVTGVYETLLDSYVIKYLVPMVEIELAPHLNVEMRNKAVGKSSDETINAGTDSEVYSLGESIRKSAQVYPIFLQQWRCFNL